MKKLGFGFLASLMFCVQGHAAVDLYSSDPQPLPEDSAQAIYTNLAKEVSESCDGQNACTIHLKNFYCESVSALGLGVAYTCSYGKNLSFTGEHAEGIYKALMQAGFVSDCDDQPMRHCDVDPISNVNCKVSRTAYSELAYGCEIAI